MEVDDFSFAINSDHTNWVENLPEFDRPFFAKSSNRRYAEVVFTSVYRLHDTLNFRLKAQWIQFYLEWWYAS